MPIWTFGWLLCFTSVHLKYEEPYVVSGFIYQMGNCAVFMTIWHHLVASSENLVMSLVIHVNAESIIFENPKITVSLLDFY
jgi:hypothetical protein